MIWALGIVLSHPFANTKAKGWDTEICGKDENDFLLNAEIGEHLGLGLIHNQEIVAG